jgi:Fe-S oxidoreductase
MKVKHLKKWKNELITCTMCGYCKNVCPTFLDIGWDAGSARGRNLLAYGMLTEELEPDEVAALRLYQCTLCLDCLRRCPSNVNVPEIVEAARADIVDAGLATGAQKEMIDTVKQAGNIYGTTETRVPPQDGEITLFLGCQYLERPNQVKVILNVFDKLGIKPQIFEEVCCGVPFRNLGFFEDLEKHKEKFLASLPTRELVTFCPTCTLFLKEEYDLPITHATEIVAEKLSGANPKELNIEATYHDPCHLGRGAEVHDAPRKILETIGVTVKEMPLNKKTTRCCGGGGVMLVSDALLAGVVAKRRIEQAKATGVQELTTSCANCVGTLRTAAQASGESGSRMKVRDIWYWLWQALK